jgi:methylmalonyl-CoA mutase N-terminal domain/subunit
MAVESGELPVVGLNCFQMEEDNYPGEIFQVPETLAVQEAKLRRIRRERDASAVERALSEVARCCEAGGNLMEVLVEAVRSRVTEGEITSVLKKHYGTWEVPLF